MEFTLYTADCRGRPENTFYPHRNVIRSAADLRSAVALDHVCAEFADFRRSNSNYIRSDVLVMDCDNDHTDDAKGWIRPEMYRDVFPDVSLAVVPSRHDGKEKDGKSARPRHHVYFPCNAIESAEACAELKQKIYSTAPAFDGVALDAARFIYGSQTGNILWIEGTRTIAEFLEEKEFEEYDRQTGNIQKGSRNSTMSRLAGKLIKRYGDTAEARRIFDEKARTCTPPLSDGELNKIWSSAVKFGQKVERQDGYVSPEEYNKAPEWEEPIPFDDYDLPAFPVDALPPAIRDYVRALAESTQTPVDMAATSAIAVLSVCMQGKFKIRAKADWEEPVNLFILNVMNPSERKSAVESAVIRPLNVYESEQNMKNAALIESSKMQKRVLERRQKAIEEQAAKGKAAAEEIQKIAEEIAFFQEVKPMKLYVDDITTEKLTSVLAANDGRAAILSTEGGIFDTLAGTYSKTVNIDVMLKGYSGDSIRVDRIGRNSESIMNPALTVLLMVQPNVLAGLMQNSTFRGRGLTARFLYCIPTSFVGKRKYRSSSVPDAVYGLYDRCIRNMLEEEPDVEPEIIILSKEADSMIEAFAEELEPKLQKEYLDISDWAGKLVGNTLRISALLCRAGTYRDHDFLELDEPLVVSGETMADAIQIANYFMAHAKAAFMLMGADPVVSQGRKVLETVRNKGLTEFNRRDIMRACRTFRKAEDVQKALDRLLDYGYITEKNTVAYSGKGRPPSQVYLVNPYIFENQT